MKKTSAFKYAVLGIIIATLISSLGLLGRLFSIFSMTLGTVAIIAPILAIVYGKKELESNPQNKRSKISIFLGIIGIMIQMIGLFFTIRLIFNL